MSSFTLNKSKKYLVLLLLVVLIRFSVGVFSNATLYLWLHFLFFCIHSTCVVSELSCLRIFNLCIYTFTSPTRTLNISLFFPLHIVLNHSTCLWVSFSLFDLNIVVKTVHLPYSGSSNSATWWPVSPEYSVSLIFALAVSLILFFLF